MAKRARGVGGPWPVLQAALDFLELDRALNLASEAVHGGADWLEAGTPLIKSEGFEAVRRLRVAFPKLIIVADLKTMDAGQLEFEAAAQAGADVAVVMAAASDAAISQCAEAGHKHGLKVFCDLLGVPAAKLAGRVGEVARLGVDIIGVHVPIDEQMSGRTPLADVKAARAETSLPLAAAGGVTPESAPALIRAGADIVIVGGALRKAEDARRAARLLRKALDAGKPQASAPGRRTGGDGIRENLLKASTSNLSDAMRHRPCLPGLASRTPGLRLAGPAQTVRSAPGDWSKVVQAIDQTPAGGTLVADCGGVPPAVFGELAARSARNRRLAGVAIHGAVRDIAAAGSLGLPIFSTLVCSHAGDPKGFGEIGAEISIGGQAVRPGDWVFGDDDGVMVLPREMAAEYASRAADVARSEARLTEEIRAGRTLSELANLKEREKR